MTEVICSKCNIKLEFGLECHFHCYFRDCTFVCRRSHDHPADGGFCGPLTCGTYHEHCNGEGCWKVFDEEDEEINGLCSLCEETKNNKSS